jgi:hypothetical protein
MHVFLPANVWKVATTLPSRKDCYANHHVVRTQDVRDFRRSNRPEYSSANLIREIAFLLLWLSLITDGTYNMMYVSYVGVQISLWLFLFPIFLFAAQRKEFFLDGLNKLDQ